MGYLAQNREYQQWPGHRDFQAAEEDFRKMRSQPQPFGMMKRERSRSGEKENLRQQY